MCIDKLLPRRKLLSQHSCEILDKNTHFFCISNLVAKAPGLNLGEKVSNLLSSRKVLNSSKNFFPSQNNGLDKFMCPTVKKFLKFLNKKSKYNTVQYKIIITKKLYLFYKFINKKCNDLIYSVCE